MNNTGIKFRVALLLLVTRGLLLQLVIKLLLKRTRVFHCLYLVIVQMNDTGIEFRIALLLLVSTTRVLLFQVVVTEKNQGF